MQALTIFSLSWNEIGDPGAQYLSDVLRITTVKHQIFIGFIFISFASNRRL